MSAIADLVTLLLSTGIPPESISAAVDLAQRHAVETAEFHRNSTGIPPETASEKRKAWDRERKRKIAETKKGGCILTSFSEEILKEEEESKKEEVKKERAREAELESFDLFWGRWPHKVGKSAALKSFRSALKRACHAEIMAGVENYIRDKPPDRHWLNPATFLNQDRWSDQPAQVIHGTFKTNSGGSLTASLRRDLAALEQSDGSNFELPVGRILRLSN